MPAPDAQSPLAPGTMLGKYEVLRLLAVGGMAEIYLARATGIGGFEKTVVLKRIQPALAANTEFVDMFLDEARLTASFSHPNVVQVHDVDRVGQNVFFTMDYVNGRDLGEVLREAAAKKRGLSLALAIYVISNVAAGLHYAHDKKDKDGQPLGTVHRDLSPSNVMLSYDGLVKIVDFGIAKAAVRHSKTKTGTVKGTVYYMSPEQTQGIDIDRRSDVWSLGVLLYELTTGTRPFRAKNDFAVLYKIVNEDAPLPSSRRANYSPALERIVMKALRRPADERYATANELKTELDVFARDEGLHASSANLAALMRELFEPGEDESPVENLQLPREATGTRITSAASTSRVIPLKRGRIWPWLAVSAAGLVAIAAGLTLRKNANVATPVEPTATVDMVISAAPSAEPPPPPSASAPIAAPSTTPRAPIVRAREREASRPPPSAPPKEPAKWNLDSPLPP